MISVKNHQQGNLFDAWAYLGPKRRKLLVESWAGLFRERILGELPVLELAKDFQEDFGRPTKELYTITGTVLLQQMFDLSDEETVSQAAFNQQWHYALDISGESDEAKYICLKTLFNFRKRLLDKGLDQVVFDGVTRKLAEVFRVEASKQRLDSVHIKSNMRRLGRIGLMVRTIIKFLVNLKRRHREMFEALPGALAGKYLTPKARSCFSLVKPSESARTLAEVSQDLFDLACRFKGVPEVCSLHSFTLLMRVLSEQCQVEETAAGESRHGAVAVKPAAKVDSDSLQNPSDPEAGYDGHKGQGCQVQVMETYIEASDPDVKARTLNLITHVQVEPAHVSDAEALVPALESVERRELAPDQVVADSLYGGDDNLEAAKEMGVEVVSPVMGRPEREGLTLGDFSFSEKGQVVSCPAGQVPVKVRLNPRKKRHGAAFDSVQCRACTQEKDCPVKPGRNHHYLRYTDKSLRASVRRSREQTPEFKEKYRWRAGVEAAMSQFDRLTGVKRLRVRGLQAVRFCATLKAAGVNIFRATTVQKARKAARRAAGALKSGFLRPVLIFKERLNSLRTEPAKFLAPFSTHLQLETKMAA